MLGSKKKNLPTVYTRTGLAFEGAEKDVEGYTYREVTGI